MSAVVREINTNLVGSRPERGYRAIQIPRDSGVCLYDGEVTSKNAEHYNIMFIANSIFGRVLTLFGQDHAPSPSDNMTLNEMLAVMCDALERNPQILNPKEAA